MKSSTSTNSETVASPCRRLCCPDQRELCPGCGRSLAEILERGRADDRRRRAICRAARARLQMRPGAR